MHGSCNIELWAEVLKRPWQHWLKQTSTLHASLDLLNNLSNMISSISDGLNNVRSSNHSDGIIGPQVTEEQQERRKHSRSAEIAIKNVPHSFGN